MSLLLHIGRCYYLYSIILLYITYSYYLYIEKCVDCCRRLEGFYHNFKINLMVPTIEHKHAWLL